jgi:hypothetical protein
MSFEEDNGFYKKDGLSGEQHDDDRELEMEAFLLPLEALGVYDESVPVIEPEPVRVSNVTLNGFPIYVDSFEDESGF